MLKLTPLRLAAVPPPMAHNELTMDSNIIDVAFSKSGTRIAVLMNDHFSVFLWSLKGRPVVAPILESSYPLSDAPDSRPRQIAFLQENEVYILKNSGPDDTQIERTTLETRVTKIAHQAAASEHLFSIFPALDHESLWFSHVSQPGKLISYSSITPQSHDEFAVTSCTQSPKADTYWADVVPISDDEVSRLNVHCLRRSNSCSIFW
jgi:elongator complex protein 1